MTRSRGIRIPALLLAAAACALPAHAQKYPAKPIRIIVPFAPGGPNDILARLVGQRLAEAWGQQVIVDNRPGGSTMIGSELAAKAAPDGYTLLLNSITTHGIGPHLYPSLPYDSMKDFTPVILVARLPLIMTINTGHEMKSVQDVIAHAKANPGKLTFASGNTSGVVAGETLKYWAKIDMLHVPYKSAPPALQDLLAIDTRPASRS